MNYRQAARVALITILGGVASTARAFDSQAGKPNTSTTELGEISTDRPDFTESTDTIAPGYIQIEGGILFNHHTFASTRSMLGPSPLIRVGLTRFIEFRIGGDGYVSESEAVGLGRENHTGISDIEAGAKIRLW